MYFQVNKSSSDFWNNIEVTWQQCANLPKKCWATSVAALDGNVYASVFSDGCGWNTPFMYDSNRNQWSELPELPCWHFTIVAVTKMKQLLVVGGNMHSNDIIDHVVTNKIHLWDEKYRKWVAPYPNMPTARCCCSSISHGSTVIVAGGITCWEPYTQTRSVEILHINDGNFHESHWSTVEQLPYVMRKAIPFIVNDKLYIAQGYIDDDSTCNILTASMPELLQSSNNNISSSRVWNKLPDMPYSSHSINYYQDRLITFTGDRLLEQPDEDEPIYKLVPLINIYNPVTMTWDCVGDVPLGYCLGLSVHIRENKILFIGGLTGTHDINNRDDIITTCSMLTLTSQ